MAGLSQTIAENWAVIREAPEAFAVLIVVIIGVVWATLHFLKANQIGNLESRLQLRDDEIADYKRKLAGASPDEAAARIAALEATVAKLGPRKLSLEQRQAMIRFLHPYGGCEIDISADAGSADGAHLQRGLIAAFQESGWTANASMVMGPNRHPRTGLGLIVPEIAMLTGAQQAVANALEVVGLEFDRIEEPMQPRFPGQAPPVGQIIITTRLDD